MARPIKDYLDYFPLDVNFFDNHKVILIEEDFGVKGGYLALRLMAMVYEKGYYLEWKANSELSCAKRVGNGYTGALVEEILKSCLRHSLFNQKLFDKYRVLTSVGIQERWLRVQRDLRRKIVIDNRYWLVIEEETGVSSEETRVIVAETTAPATFSTQKEIRINKIKLKEKNTGGEAVASQRELLLFFEEFKENEGKVREYVESVRPNVLEPYVVMWNFFAKEKKLPQVMEITEGRRQKFAERYVEKRFDFPAIIDKVKQSPFLLKGVWFSFDWILDNDGNYLKILEGNYDSGNAVKGEIAKAEVSEDVIQYLQDRFVEGDLDRRMINEDHYQFLHKTVSLQISESDYQEARYTRMQALAGSNISSELRLLQDYEKMVDTDLVKKDVVIVRKMAKRNAVLGYFKKKFSESQ